MTAVSTDPRAAPLAASPTARQIASRRAIALWLSGICGLLFVMIVIGGLTRLTDSGLSIVEWRPVTGTIPPLSEAQWLVELEKYRTTHEYQMQNRGMSLEEFKVIYWWEWGHRFFGRLIGIAFAIPFLVFRFTRRIEPALMPRLVLMFALGGLQGAVGWWMVASGLSARLDVSQYRLAMHLGMAFAIFGFILWTALALFRTAPGSAVAPPARTDPRLAALLPWSLAFAALIFVQIILGAFVAGTDSGFTYNTWPLMDGQFIPNGLFNFDPPWLAFFELPTMIQFQHRMVAYAIAGASIVLWLATLRATPIPRVRLMAHALLACVLAQVALGIWTLLAIVPTELAAAHQAMAVVLLGLALALAFELRWHGLGAPRFLPVAPARGSAQAAASA